MAVASGKIPVRVTYIKNAGYGTFYRIEASDDTPACTCEVLVWVSQSWWQRHFGADRKKDMMGRLLDGVHRFHEKHGKVVEGKRLAMSVETFINSQLKGQA